MATNTLLAGKQFNVTIPSTATSIIFTDEVAPEGYSLVSGNDVSMTNACIDVSAEQDGSVVSWLDTDGVTYKVSTQISGVKILFNEDCSSMFINKSSLTSISFNNVTTKATKNISKMFYTCSSLQSVDVGQFDTSNITNMSRMFRHCHALEEIIGLDKWDTSNVTIMSEIFSTNPGYSISNHLKVLDLSSWNTSKVTDMNGMFQSSRDLVSIRFGEGWDTSNVVNMANMFNNCLSLIELDVAEWNTTKATNMSNMFKNCSSLTNLDVSNWNTASVTNMTSLFNGCQRLEKITFGSQFNFNGNGTASCVLPTQSNTYIDGADGNWYTADGIAYAPTEIPNLTAATYYASASFAKHEHNKNKLIDLNGLEVYHAENIKYINNVIKTAKLAFILNSSTEASTKQFKLTIDDNGTLTVSEIVAEEVK